MTWGSHCSMCGLENCNWVRGENCEGQQRRQGHHAMTDKIVLTPQDEARHVFDAENNVEPCRTIAERIVLAGYLMDDISHAIEDARALGEKRGAAEIERLTILHDTAKHWEAQSLADNEINRLRATCQERDAEQGRLDADNARLRAAVGRLMDQPTMNPLDMTPDQRKELWAAHEEARAALEPKP